MKLCLITVGKTHIKELEESIRDYSKRINRYHSFEFIETSDEKLEKTLEKFERVYLLDEKGYEYRSVDFAKFIDKHLVMGVKNIAFVIGGPYGFTETIRNTSDGEISLSKMTFPHDLVRVIFLEQLYRACTILKNEKYHHE